MMIRRTAIPKQLKALLAAWIAIIFGTSALFALASPIQVKTYSKNWALNLFISTWEIADEIGPIVKLSIILIFALLVLISANLIRGKTRMTYLVNASLAIIATGLVLGLLPRSYSRGFGIGVTGTRFDSQTLPIYLIGSVLGGLVYSYSLTKKHPNPAHI
ncbi:hypothetical protein GCM10028818_60190 [Spirosoma horti]